MNFKGSCCNSSESSHLAIMTGTQYFNRHEKDSLVLRAPTQGPQPTAVTPRHPSIPAWNGPAWVSFHVYEPRSREALVLSRHWYGRLLTQNSRPTVAVTWLPASPLWTLTRRGLMVSTPRWLTSLWVGAGSGVFGCGVPSTQSVPADAIDSPCHPPTVMKVQRN